MTKLSVNINKVATLRNARGGNLPNVQQFAIDIQKMGAEGITVHPRPDERHIRYEDVRLLKPLISTEFNIEGYPSDEFMSLIEEVRPHQVTLVPDPPEVLTSNAGWKVKKHFSLLRSILDTLHAWGCRSSIFVDTDKENIRVAADIGTNRIELYTEEYARNYILDRKKAVREYKEAAEIARSIGLGINAGHDLNLDNLSFFHEEIPYIDEVSIGHAIISDALYFGIEDTIRRYKQCLLTR